MKQIQVEGRIARLQGEIAAARKVLGLALLNGKPTDEQWAALNTLELDLRDAECMREAFMDYEAQQNLAAMRLRPAPVSKRGRLAEYQKRRIEFRNRIQALKRHGGLLAEGNQLLVFAKKCGQRAISDCEALLKGIHKGPWENMFNRR